MSGKRRSPDTPESWPASGLNRLVATEEALEARVREAHEEAARIVLQAREQHQAARDRLQRDLAPAIEQLLASIEERARRETETLEHTRVQEVAAYAAIQGERLDVLARIVVAHVIASRTTRPAAAAQ